MNAYSGDSHAPDRERKRYGPYVFACYMKTTAQLSTPMLANAMSYGDFGFGWTKAMYN